MFTLFNSIVVSILISYSYIVASIFMIAFLSRIYCFLIDISAELISSILEEAYRLDFPLFVIFLAVNLVMGNFKLKIVSAAFYSFLISVIMFLVLSALC